MRERLAAVRERAREAVEASLQADHTPHEVAASFALGVFVTALPTGRTALLLFVAIAYLFERVSKLALAASLVVFNPVVKWSVYGASFWLGTRLLGPVPGVSARPSLSEFTLDAGRAVLVRHLLGNALLAVLFAVLGYLVVRALLRGYHEFESVVEDGTAADR